MERRTVRAGDVRTLAGVDHAVITSSRRWHRRRRFTLDRTVTAVVTMAAAAAVFMLGTLLTCRAARTLLRLRHSFDPLLDSPYAPDYKGRCDGIKCDDSSTPLDPRGYLRRGDQREYVTLKGDPESSVTSLSASRLKTLRVWEKTGILPPSSTSLPAQHLGTASVPMPRGQGAGRSETAADTSVGKDEIDAQRNAVAPPQPGLPLNEAPSARLEDAGKGLRRRPAHKYALPQELIAKPVNSYLP